MGILVNQRKKGIEYLQGVEPSNPKVGMTWNNTGPTKTFKIRNKDNNGWDTLSFGGVGKYGYFCGGTINGFSHFSYISKLTFPFDSGTTSIVGNLSKNLSSGSGCNSSNVGYIFPIGSTTIEKINFPFDSGNSQYFNTSGVLSTVNTCNSSTHGYLFNVGLTTINRITFPFDSGSLSVVGNLNFSRYFSTRALNSSIHGFCMDGNDGGGTYKINIERITFPFDTGTATSLGNMYDPRLQCAVLNSSTYGHMCGGYNQGSSYYYSNTERLLFPFDSGNSILVGNLTATQYHGSGINSTLHGFVVGGNRGAGNTTYIERFSFPFDSGSSTVTGNLSYSTILGCSCDETDFITQFI